jgi:hypothetical protein
MIGRRSVNLTLMRFIVIFVFVSPLVFGQKTAFIKPFHFSIVPALGTNGLHPGGYTNYFAINLTSGYSSANYILEIGGISNLNVNETRGIQFAGIANITGGNAYQGMQAKEIDKIEKAGFEANLSGAQFSGLANVVLKNVFGWQTTGGMNVVKGALVGLQIAGISNTVKKYSFGVQLSGVWNVSAESMDGIQISSLFNATTGGLYGFQLGAFNKAGFIEGRNSFNSKDPTGLQLGLVNMANSMNGFQIGLINIGKRMQGTQIGLINIYRNGRTPQTRDGTSIGLLNIGSGGYFSVYATELFYTNVEIATGTIKNRRMSNETKEVQIQNALIFSNEMNFIREHPSWALGYGLKKMYFNRSATPGVNKLRYVSFGSDFMHINHDRKKITNELSLVTRPGISFGTRLHPNLKGLFRSLYFFGSIAYNFYLSGSGKSIAPSLMASDGKIGNKMYEMWPGFSAGIHIQ